MMEQYMSNNKYHARYNSHIECQVSTNDDDDDSDDRGHHFGFAGHVNYGRRVDDRRNDRGDWPPWEKEWPKVGVE